MDVEDKLPVELPTNNTSLTRAFYVFVLVPTMLGAAHHVDHIIRGNHVGWPITPEVNAFTYSLAIYPLLAISLYLTMTRRVEARYWVGFFAFSAGMLAYFHISPWAKELLRYAISLTRVVISMPDHITCYSCGKTVFGFTLSEPRPVDGEECPRCGGTEFKNPK